MTYRLRLVVGITAVTALAGGLALALAADSTPPDSTGEIAAAEEAMSAWARFASTGDLQAVKGVFAEDGPQYQQLVQEAPTLSNEGAHYRFALADPVLLQPGLVRGLVTVSRPGEPDQNYVWDVELRLMEGRWQVWTVRTANPGF